MVPGCDGPAEYLRIHTQTRPRGKYQTNAMGFVFLIPESHAGDFSIPRISADVFAGSRDPHARVLENARDRRGFADRDRDEIDVEFRKHRASDPVTERLDELVLLVCSDVFDDLENSLVVDGPPDPVRATRLSNVESDLQVQRDRPANPPLRGRDTERGRDLDPFQ